jgi:hypothetical protein
MKFPRFLTYGNWGGPGWCGGEYVSDPAKTNWNVPAVDDMDDEFKSHDWKYQHGFSQWYADLNLVNKLVETNVRGVWPNIYRVAAMGVFIIKGAACWFLGV